MIYIKNHFNLTIITMKPIVQHSLIFILAVASVISCQKVSSELNRSDVGSVVLTKAPDYKDSGSIDFFYKTDKEEWLKIGRIEERIKAVDIPEDILKDKSTDVLAEAIFNHPLNYLIHAYNDPKKAVEYIIKNSTLHSEFISRPDAGKCISKLFSSSDIDMTESLLNDEDSYTNELFLEHFMALGIIPDLYSEDNMAMILPTVESRLSERLNDTTLFSAYSTAPLVEMMEMASPSGLSTASSFSYSFVTLRTIFGHTLIGTSPDEMSSQELIRKTNAMCSSYPYAILRGSATNKYNGNSYAWIHSSTDNTIWLESEYLGSFQLSNLWTNDRFVSCPESEAEIAYYADGEHSAIILPSGKYMSKWDNGPLMEHDEDYCPFPTSDIQYFKERTEPLDYPGLLSGPSYVNVGESYTFSHGTLGSDISFTWSVRYMESDMPSPSTLVETGIDQVRLTCHDAGLFTIYLDGYHDGNHIIQCRQNVIAMPQN